MTITVLLRMNFRAQSCEGWGSSGFGDPCINLVPKTQFFIPVLVCDQSVEE